MSDQKTSKAATSRPPKSDVTDVLPGEDMNEFRRLYERLCLEFAPEGILEEEQVLSIAKCLWRLNHMDIFNCAAHLAAKFKGYFDRGYENGLVRAVGEQLAGTKLLIQEQDELQKHFEEAEDAMELARGQAAELFRDTDSAAIFSSKDTLRMESERHEAYYQLAAIAEDITPDALSKQIKVRRELWKEVDSAIARLWRHKETRSKYKTPSTKRRKTPRLYGCLDSERWGYVRLEG